MNDYKNHKELIRKIKEQNCSKSLRILMDDFSPLFKHINYYILSNYKNIPLEREDLENVIQFNFHKLILKYEEDRGMEFGTYIKRYLNFQTRNYVREFFKKNESVMNYRSEFEEELVNSSLQINMIDEDFDEIIKLANLTPKELQVVRILTDNETISMQELADQINMSKKTVYYLRKKAIDKIRKAI